MEWMKYWWNVLKIDEMNERLMELMKDWWKGWEIDWKNERSFFLRSKYLFFSRD